MCDAARTDPGLWPVSLLTALVINPGVDSHTIYHNLPGQATLHNHCLANTKVIIMLGFSGASVNNW